MFGFLRADNNHRYTVTEDDMILRDLQRAFNFRYYSGVGLSASNRKGNSHLLARVLTREDKAIDIFENPNKWGIPLHLVRKGVKGVYSYDKRATYLYAVKDHIMTEIKDGRVMREWETPRLSYYSSLDTYIKRL